VFLQCNAMMTGMLGLLRWKVAFVKPRVVDAFSAHRVERATRNKDGSGVPESLSVTMDCGPSRHPLQSCTKTAPFGRGWFPIEMQDGWSAGSDECGGMTSSFDERRSYSIVGVGAEQRATKSDPYLMEYFLNGGVRGILKKFQSRNQVPGQGTPIQIFHLLQVDAIYSFHTLFSLDSNDEVPAERPFENTTDLSHGISGPDSSIEERGAEIDVRYMGLYDCSDSDSLGFLQQFSPPFPGIPAAVPAEKSDPRIGSYLLTENYMLEVARRPEIWKEPPMLADAHGFQASRPWAALDQNPPFPPHSIPAWPAQAGPSDHHRGTEIERRYFSAGATAVPQPQPPGGVSPARFQTFST
jgi:hypothetical protein